MKPLNELSWLGPQWRALTAYIESGRIPQALMIVGAEGVGKTHLAIAFANRLLCRNPGEYACGECPACHLLAAGTHPDFLRIEPEEPGKIIPVEVVRGLIANLGLKPQYSGRRVVLISPAHQMNASSANSLLKTLEEPDERTTLVLSTDSPQALPATILSRCQRMEIPIPDRTFSIAWLDKQGLGGCSKALLALARGAPLKALALASDGAIEKRGEFFTLWCELLEKGGDPTSLAENWHKYGLETLAFWMSSWTMDMIRLHSAPSRPKIDNLDLTERLQSLSKKIGLQQLFDNLDRLNAARRMLSSQINRQLLLEELLIFWLRSRTNLEKRRLP